MLISSEHWRRRINVFVCAHYIFTRIFLSLSLCGCMVKKHRYSHFKKKEKITCVEANEAYQVGLIRQKKNGSCSPLLVGLLLEFLFHPLGSYIRHLVACEWLFVLLFQGLSSRPCARVHRIGLHLAR